ncbi:MAG TPA: TIGR00730 family Rossman fold protein, partial [bacterium]|nr:TIGR00730 family Rossman fold protein [bacterium]
MNVCVYCSSSDQVDHVYFETAKRLGKLLGERKNTLVYGGANVGPMLELANSVKEAGGRVVSVIPKIVAEKGLVYTRSDERVITATLQERRITMIKGSDVFIALPGGFGTLEEVTENLTMRQLGVHRKPLVLVNTGGFWDGLASFVRHLRLEHFILPEHESLVHMASTPEEALEYLDHFVPGPLPDKWGLDQQ